MSDARTAAELRQLIALLERSGMAERRSDARALLESSRALLRAQQSGRAVPSARKLAGKLGRIGLLACDSAVATMFCAGLAGALGGRMAGPVAFGLMLAGPAWLASRAPQVRAAVEEGLRMSAYHLAWGWDWFAEAFSSRAMLRLAARLEAREVMRAWRRHRSTLAERPMLSDVAEFLLVAHGAAAWRGWEEAVAEPRGRRWRRRLAALRWSALTDVFETMAAAGALAPPGAPFADPAAGGTPPALPAPVIIAAERPADLQRRQDLRELIRRKRADITTAYTWKLKTPAEIAQRERHVDELKADIAALERELEGLGA